MKYRSKWLAVPLLVLIVIILLLGKTMMKNDGEKKEYMLTGTETHYEISVGDAKESVVIHMKDLQLTGSEAPVLKILGSADVTLVLEGENILQAVTPETDQVQPVLSTEGRLTICGEGSLTVRGMYQDGIHVKNNFSMSSGTLSVAAGDDALEAEALVRISGGSVFLDAEDYLIHCDGEQELTRGCVFYEKQ